MAHKSYKEESKKDWGTSASNLTLEQVQAGAFLRIADATEKMAINYTKMLNDLNWYKEKYDEKSQEIERLNNTIRGYKGYLKRVKSKSNKI